MILLSRRRIAGMLLASAASFSLVALVPSWTGHADTAAPTVSPSASPLASDSATTAPTAPSSSAQPSASVTVPTTPAATAPASSAASLASAAAKPKPGPSLTVTPATNLVDGQFVRISATKQKANTGFRFRQCTAKPLDQISLATDCTFGDSNLLMVITKQGTGSVYVPVYADDEFYLHNSARTGVLTCDATNPCVLLAMLNRDDIATATEIPIAFGPSLNTCPIPDASNILGSGSASAFIAMLNWETTVCHAPSNLSVGYTLLNSEDGISNFLNLGLTDYAITGPLPSLPSSSGSQQFAYAPLTGSALVLAYRIYDRRGPQVTNLKLTPDLISQVFQGAISNWNINADIKALNPGINFPPLLRAFGRADHDSENLVFTSWLAAHAPSWKLGKSDNFPSATVTLVTGSAAVARGVLDPSTDTSAYGSIAWMDSSTAAFYGLPTVQIQTDPANPATAVAATPDTIQRALANAPATPTPYTPTDPQAYPMPLVTYVMAPTNKFDAAKGKVLAKFIRFATSVGSLSLPPGYASLPANLVNASQDTADQVPVTPPPSPTPSPTPTPSASASSSSSASFGSGNAPFSAPILPNAPPSLAQPAAAAAQAGASAGTSSTAKPVVRAAPVALLSENPSHLWLPIVVALLVVGMLGLLLTGSEQLGVAAAGLWRRRTAALPMLRQGVRHLPGMRGRR
jgi:phosphate transport system substrate-binding protein